MNHFPTTTERVTDARRLARTASELTWNTRVLLAAAEAADACVRPELRAPVACAIADKAAHTLDGAHRASTIHHAIVDALVSTGLAAHITAPTVTRITWRILFDLNGGPDKQAA